MTPLGLGGARCQQTGQMADTRQINWTGQLRNGSTTSICFPGGPFERQALPHLRGRCTIEDIMRYGGRFPQILAEILWAVVRQMHDRVELVPALLSRRQDALVDVHRAHFVLAFDFRRCRLQI
jgi:hypothetical protein